MNILINCSNLKKGGGLQVADSVCRCLKKFSEHSFVVVLSSYLNSTAEAIEHYGNVEVIRHGIRNDWRTILFGRDKVLDALVKEKRIDAVLTIFGPARWKPRVRHVCGFARAHLVLAQSPYYQILTAKELIQEKISNRILKHFFARGVDAFWTENPYISRKVRALFGGKKVETVTNYYNQVFDLPDQWREHALPPFDGTTLLSVNAPYRHKNLEITIDAAKILKKRYEGFRFRFVMTVSATDFNYDFAKDTDGIADCFCLIGKVDVSECPSLYKQADICFQPTLLECFTATYPEAMKMEVPIVTTDIEFAKGLCGDAAKYYSPLGAQACADAIYEVATNQELQKQLVETGKEQLKSYDNYNDRARKLIEIVVGR